MERYSHDPLAEALRELRPTPRPEFAAELDRRAAAGFPPPEEPHGAPARSRIRRLVARLAAVPPRRVALPAGGLAVAAAVVAAVAVMSYESEPQQPPLGGRGDAEAGIHESALRPNVNPDGAAQSADRIAQAAGTPPKVEEFWEAQRAEGRSGDHLRASGESPGAGSPDAKFHAFSEKAPSASATLAPASRGGVAAQTRNRDIERSAELTLATDPAGVGDAASQVFDAVHAQRGIVLRSSTREGEAGEAGAYFELLIPSGRLGDALAALSEVAEVRSRREATADITAPTITVGERLQDSRARIDGLLAQLADADTEAEREAVERELRGERRRAAFLRSRLARLNRRANFARVSVRIETGAPSSSAGGGWGVGEALGDAGRILTVAAGVALIGLAILGPIALIALLAWLAHRAWLRRARQRTLG